SRLEHEFEVDDGSRSCHARSGVLSATFRMKSTASVVRRSTIGGLARTVGLGAKLICTGLLEEVRANGSLLAWPLVRMGIAHHITCGIVSAPVTPAAPSSPATAACAARSKRTACIHDSYVRRRHRRRARPASGCP